jgi:hypothetical protein
VSSVASLKPDQDAAEADAAATGLLAGSAAGDSEAGDAVDAANHHQAAPAKTAATAAPPASGKMREELRCTA